MNPSSHCRTSVFEEEFEFQYVRGDIHIHIATQKCRSGIFPGNISRQVSPNIWNINAF